MLDLNGDLGKLLISMALGTAVGLERELSDKPAGLKTNVLICLGSTIFTILSVKLSGNGGDPGRVAAQIASGIGFLGAGAIMRDGEQVTGLTTAATIWIVAAIGMGAGLGYHTLAALGTLGALAVQVAMTPLDIIVDGLRQRHTFKILSAAEDQSIEAIAKIIKSHGIHVMRRKVMKKNHLFNSEWVTSGPQHSQENVVRELLKSERVIEVTY